MKYTLRVADPDAARELGRASGLSPMVAQVLLHRGIRTAQEARAFAQPRLAALSDPSSMRDRGAAAERLARAVRAGERIAIFGDYDVDGTTSTAILSDALEAMGGEVTPFVANRFEGGYGFNDAALDRVMAARPSVIVTCDCGSSDHERIARAGRLGVDVIVVDHHLVPVEPLPALAFLNPHRPDCGFAYKGLASAGLVFSLAAAVRSALGATLDLRAWLDLVALGTIADVAPLDGDNRALVRAGLQRMGERQGRPGVSALGDVAGLQAGAWSAIEMAFRLTPRLNAAGRMGDPTLTLELLRATDPTHAKELAARIDLINEQRKVVEREVTAAAIAQVRSVYGDDIPPVIVAAGDGWHRGVVGITAARLSETFGVSAVAIALDGDVGHGSGRAWGGHALYDVLASCRSLLRTFGGHQAASGLSIDRRQIGPLREALRALAGAAPAPRDEHAWVVDVVVDGNSVPLPTATDLWALEPLGERNPEPQVLLPGAVVDRVRQVGEGHLKLSLRLGRQGVSAFGLGMAARAPIVGQRLNALGALRPDRWAGEDRVELRLADFELVG